MAAQQHGARGGRWPRAVRLALVGLASVTMLGACSSTPQPSPLAVSPAASTPAIDTVTPTVAAPSRTPAATSSPAAPGAPSPTTTSTVVVSPLGKPTRSTGPVLRRTYPGIKKLVIVHSTLNRTETGSAAVNAVAAYNSALATSLVSRSTSGLRKLSDSSCTQCQADIDRIDQFIKDGNTIVNSDGSTGFASAAVDLMEVYEPSKATVEVNTYELPSKFLVHGRTIDRSPALVVNLLYSTERVGKKTVIFAISPTS